MPQQESPTSPATTAVQPQTEAVPSQGWAVRPPGKCDRVCGGACSMARDPGGRALVIWETATHA